MSAISLVADLTPDEITNLMREAARGGAQDAITTLEAKNQLNTKAYLSIDSPATVLSLLAAVCASLLYLVGAETRPLEGSIQTNEKNIEKNEAEIKVVRKEINGKLDRLIDLSVKKK
jgi:hypothetical protein